MLVKTKAIVLNSLNYSDRQIIASFYTEAMGRISCLIRRGKSKSTNQGSQLLQPLFLLDIELYVNPGRSIQNLKEMRNLHPLISLSTHHHKQSIVLFLSEILVKTLKEQEQNPALFAFLTEAIISLDRQEKGIGVFHLFFLIHLTRHLGFFPLDNYSEQNPLFSLSDGNFTGSLTSSDHVLDPETSRTFHRLLTIPFENYTDFILGKNLRDTMLDRMIEFYKLHIPATFEIKSLEILREVFRQDG
jgi:DNA repair protein RecO (recombination protein O)